MNKNTQILLGVLVVIVVIIGGVFFTRGNSPTPTTSSTQDNPAVQDSTVEEENMEEHMMMGIGYIMTDGKMMVEEGGKFTPMTSAVTLDDGTVVSVSGEVTKTDGTKFTLLEGQSMWTDGMFMEAGEMMGDDSSMSSDSSDLSTRYVDYSEENLALATESNGRAIVFFHANWCPLCRAAEADFKANFDKVPSDVTILKTDYDTSTDLKKKYSITTQDIFVQVDSTGDEITKWSSGGEGIKALLANLK